MGHRVRDTTREVARARERPCVDVYVRSQLANVDLSRLDSQKKINPVIFKAWSGRGWRGLRCGHGIRAPDRAGFYSASSHRSGRTSNKYRLYAA